MKAYFTSAIAEMIKIEIFHFLLCFPFILICYFISTYSKIIVLKIVEVGSFLSTVEVEGNEENIDYWLLRYIVTLVVYSHGWL